MEKLQFIYYLLVFHFIEFFFCYQFFLECYLVEFPYFLSFMEQMKISLSKCYINVKSKDYCTVYPKDNMWICHAIACTLLFNICRIFIPTFHKNSHPTQWRILFIKNITILIFSCFLIAEKSYYISSQKSQLYLQEQSYLFLMKKAI